MSERRIVMRTAMDHEAVTYSVAYENEKGETWPQWNVRVPSGSKTTNRPGGYAFQRAAKDQQAEADRLMDLMLAGLPSAGGEEGK